MSTVSPVQCRVQLGASQLSEDDAAELETVFKALADRNRLRILNRLAAAHGTAVCVCEFEELLQMTQPAVSYHLKQLLVAGLVTRQKRGARAYFALADGTLSRVCGLLDVPALNDPAAA